MESVFECPDYPALLRRTNRTPYGERRQHDPPPPANPTIALEVAEPSIDYHYFDPDASGLKNLSPAMSEEAAHDPSTSVS
jgi:hypothetical protein